jgi:hypothetical protein
VTGSDEEDVSSYCMTSRKRGRYWKLREEYYIALSGEPLFEAAMGLP